VTKEKNFAENLAYEMSRTHELAYGCQVNLEATINNMLYYGLSEEQVTDIVNDILRHISFLDIDD